MFIRKKLLREQHPDVVKPPKKIRGTCNPDINCDENLAQLTRFQPNLLIISGTKMIAKELLETAELAINIHHGFLPAYRGVSSIDWSIIENNYNYISVMVHEAVTTLDAGPVISGAYVTPYFLEGA